MLKFYTIAIFIIAFFSCKKEEPSPISPNPNPTPTPVDTVSKANIKFVVTEEHCNAHTNPVPYATILISSNYNKILTNQYDFKGVTDTAGVYKVKLPRVADPFGKYYFKVSARICDSVVTKIRIDSDYVGHLYNLPSYETINVHFTGTN